MSTSPASSPLPELDARLVSAAETLAGFVWERFDEDLYTEFESASELVYDEETGLTKPDVYDALLTHFVSYLVDAETLRAAADLRAARDAR